jgi:hypothetical protein
MMHCLTTDSRVLYSFRNRDPGVSRDTETLVERKKAEDTDTERTMRVRKGLWMGGMNR